MNVRRMLTLSAFAVSSCLVALLVSTVRAEAAELRLTCDGSSGGYTECDTGVTVYDARVIHVQAGTCTFGQTWGTFQTKIWVNHGCAAEFGFQTQAAPAPTPIPSPRPGPGSIECRQAPGGYFYPFSNLAGREIGDTTGGYRTRSECDRAVQVSRRQNKGVMCGWNMNGFTTFNLMTNSVVGNSGVSFRDASLCNDIIELATKDLLCNSNGYAWIAYDIETSHPACHDGATGFQTLEACARNIRSSRNSLVCDWNGVNWQPFHMPTRQLIGMPGYGFADLNDCHTTLALSRRDVVCNWDGTGFRPYDVQTNASLSAYAYGSMQACYASAP